MEMEEKENECGQKQSTRKYRHRKNHKMMDEGNDYVLKRYRLEENRHFKERNNEDLNYQVSEGKPVQAQEQEEAEEQLVIVPLELPREILEEEEVVEQKKPGEGNMVYVFDDEEENEQKTEEFPPPGLSKTKQSQTEEIKSSEDRKSQSIKMKNNVQALEEFNLKKIQKYNFSTAQLMTPTSPSPNNFFNLQQAEIKNIRKTVTIKTQPEQEQKEVVLGVTMQKGKEDQETSITIVDKRLFSISKLPSGIILRCILKRTNSFVNFLSPEYDLYLANGLKHILSAKKYPMRNRELFKFSTDPVNFNDENLISVLNANTSHYIYWLLDMPRKIKDLNLSFVQLVVGYYRLKPMEEQRKFSVLLPTVNSEYQLAIQYEQSLVNFSNFKEEIKTELRNLQTWSNQSKNSTKNFVIADEGDQQYRYLELKKQSDNVFELTIQHPLSPLQAMAIAMTRFDVQLK